MIDAKDFQQRTDYYIQAIGRRGKRFAREAQSLTSLLLHRDTTKQQELEKLRAEINTASRLIPTLPAVEKKKKISELKKTSDRITALESDVVQASKTIDLQIRNLPNPPKEDVPDGDDASHNKVLREWGKKSDLKKPLDYLTVAEDLGIIDIKRAAKVSGSRFGYLLGPAAQLEFALIQYAQSILLRENFTMVIPPVMITSQNMAAMGYLAGAGGNEVYHLTEDDLYLVGTSEQSIGPMHRGETFDEQALPKRYLGFSTCFRREAGSYGKDTKGILRVHQFDKLEMFSFALPEKSDEEQEFLLAMQEKLWQGLDIPYRVVKLCSGDLGFPSARTYDIEAWLPGQGVYREMGSTSTTTDYQSRELAIRVQRQEKKELVHMLNGTAFAIGRTLIAIIENYQQADGSVAIPKVLQTYLNGQRVIAKPD